MLAEALRSRPSPPIGSALTKLEPGSRTVRRDRHLALPLVASGRSRAVGFRFVGLTFETRAAASPWIASVWTCRSDHVAQMTSVATETRGLVF